MATFDLSLVSSGDRNLVFMPESLTSPGKFQSVR
jgi:hypothetical protein